MFLNNLWRIALFSSFFGYSIILFHFNGQFISPFRFFLIMLIALTFLKTMVINGKGLSVNLQGINLGNLAISLWIPYAVFSLLWTEVSPPRFISEILIVSFNILIIITCVIYLRKYSSFKDMFIVWMVGLCIMIAIALWEVATLDHLAIVKIEQATNRVYKYAPSAVYYNTNDFAIYITLSIGILYSSVKNINSRLYRTLFGIMLLLCVFILVNTFSRSNYIAVLVIIFFDTVFLSNMRTHLRLLSTIGFLATIYFMYFSEKVFNSINIIYDQTFSLVNELKYGNERYNILVQGLEGLKSNYFMGGGPGYYPSPHNFFLEIFFDYGIINLLLWMGFIFGSMRHLYFRYKASNNNTERIISHILLLSLVGFIPGSLGPSSVLPLHPVWLLFGAVLAFQRISQNDAHPAANEA